MGLYTAEYGRLQFLISLIPHTPISVPQPNPHFRDPGRGSLSRTQAQPPSNPPPVMPYTGRG